MYGLVRRSHIISPFPLGCPHMPQQPECNNIVEAGQFVMALKIPREIFSLSLFSSGRSPRPQKTILVHLTLVTYNVGGGFFGCKRVSSFLRIS